MQNERHIPIGVTALRNIKGEINHPSGAALVSEGESEQDRQIAPPLSERQENAPLSHIGTPYDTATLRLHPTEESCREESQKRVRSIVEANHKP